MIVKTGKWLRELRIMNRLTQRETAELFRVKRSTYSNWECLYKAKILPKKVLENPAFIWLNAFKVRVIKKEQRRLTIFERIKKWIIKKFRN